MCVSQAACLFTWPRKKSPWGRWGGGGDGDQPCISFKNWALLCVCEEEDNGGGVWVADLALWKAQCPWCAPRLPSPPLSPLPPDRHSSVSPPPLLSPSQADCFPSILSSLFNLSFRCTTLTCLAVPASTSLLLFRDILIITSTYAYTDHKASHGLFCLPTSYCERSLVKQREAQRTQ